eukprot:CAMPEP_0175331064 /NCGR_PEP_ID=MMETSP0095-20121207/1052_1 /TAXON_ID=311494 /ORGANISM="Alexandrium monilatum, Strain CCMP3105" /LENGTH=232 /DNA_ID=CAMNT_0016628275 /DNA_START=318 /DNA_END=1013 /DNA_ORIENTATION=+
MSSGVDPSKLVLVGPLGPLPGSHGGARDGPLSEVLQGLLPLLCLLLPVLAHGAVLLRAGLARAGFLPLQLRGEVGLPPLLLRPLALVGVPFVVVLLQPGVGGFRAEQPLPAGLLPELLEVEGDGPRVDVVLALRDVDASQQLELDLVVLPFADCLQVDPFFVHGHLRLDDVRQGDCQVEPVRPLAPLDHGDLDIKLLGESQDNREQKETACAAHARRGSADHPTPPPKCQSE